MSTSDFNNENFPMEPTDFPDDTFPLDPDEFPEDMFQMEPIELTEELLGKIDRFAEREGKVVASKFKRFAAAVQKADFSKTDPKSIYEVRNMITHLAEVYGLCWDKLDTCSDIWHYEKSFKIDKQFATTYSVGFGIDYYEVPTSELASVIPQHILQKYGTMTAEEAKALIKEDLIDSIKEGCYWPL